MRLSAERCRVRAATGYRRPDRLEWRLASTKRYRSGQELWGKNNRPACDGCGLNHRPEGQEVSSVSLPQTTCCPLNSTVAVPGCGSLRNHVAYNCQFRIFAS